MAISESTTTTPSDAQRVLVLQGGGALGSYQGGAFEALCRHDIQPDWVAGISIGAINAALIAGNAPEDRLARVKQFWDMTTAPAPWSTSWPNPWPNPWSTAWQSPWPAQPSHGEWRSLFDEANAAIIATVGVPGFFTPRFPPAPMWPAGSVASLSYYDTEPLRRTLIELVDFKRINEGALRFSIGAVNVTTGELTYFDNRLGTTIGPEHILASAALPPGFPAVKIGDDYYWDGGISSNTPLDHVLDHADRDLLIFQVDLFSAKGMLPTTLRETVEREKDIRFSSRSYRNTEKNEQLHNARRSIAKLVESLPAEVRDLDAVRQLAIATRETTVTVIHLVYRSETAEVASRDYNFSRVAVDEHWAAGVRDINCAMRNPDWLKQPQNGKTMMVYELTDHCDDEARTVVPARRNRDKD